MAEITAVFNSITLGDVISNPTGKPNILPTHSRGPQIDRLFRQDNVMITNQGGAVYSVTFIVAKWTDATYDTYMKRLNYFNTLKGQLTLAKSTLTFSDGTTSYSKTDAYLVNMNPVENDKRGIYIQFTFQFTDRT